MPQLLQLRRTYGCNSSITATTAAAHAAAMIIRTAMTATTAAIMG